MSTPEITTVTLPCIRDGDNVYLYQNNRPRRMFNLNHLRPPQEIDLIKVKDKAAGAGKWSTACKRMRDKLLSEADAATVDGWDRWVKTRLVSIRFRKPPSKQHRSKIFNRRTRPDWSVTCRLMGDQLRRKCYRTTMNRWHRWSETTSKNANRRRR